MSFLLSQWRLRPHWNFPRTGTPKLQLYQYIRGLSNNGTRKRADFQRKIAGPAIYDDIEADILKKLMPARSDAVPNGALRCFRQTSSLV